MMLQPANRNALRHCDRWRTADMLREQPDLSRRDATWIFGVICSRPTISFG
jgi:hypothetical protein